MVPNYNLPIGTANSILPSTTLQDYLKGSRRVSDLPSKVWSDIHMLRGIGEIFVSEQDKTLYYYSGNPLFRIFSRGGRIIVSVSKVLLPMNSNRKKTLKSRFLVLDNNNNNNDLAFHLEQLMKKSNARYIPPVSKEFSTGEFRLFMQDLQTPFVEIERINNISLVVPLKLIQSLAKIGLKPRCTIQYADQFLLFANDENHTVKVFYSAHIMDHTLFTPHYS